MSEARSFQLPAAGVSHDPQPHTCEACVMWAPGAVYRNFGQCAGLARGLRPFWFPDTSAFSGVMTHKSKGFDCEAWRGRVSTTQPQRGVG